MKEKRWMKFLCLFALTFVLAISAAGVKKVSAETTSGSCGDSTTYEYDSSTKTLTISGSGSVVRQEDWYQDEGIFTTAKKLVIGDEITEIESAAFESFESLKTVTFGAKVKTIGDAAFANCSKLTSISLPSALKKIGADAFCGTGLKKVTIPKNVTSIGSGAFGDCGSLAKIAVSGSNTKYCTKSGVLYNADKTKLIQYPAGKSSSSFTVPGTVKTISAEAFYGASNLKSISLNKVKKIGEGAFFGSGLKKISIPKSVTSIGTNAFGVCNSLTKIAVSSSNTKYSAKDGVLYNKAKTKLIAYPTAKTGTSFTVPSTVKKIGDLAFYNNLKLKYLTIGSKVTEIGYGAFYGSNKLKTVVVGAKVKTIGQSTFDECFALTTVKFKGSAPEIDSGEEEYGGYVFWGVTATIKYPSAEKSSWTKSYRSALNKGAKDGGGKLTFKAY